MTVFSIVISSFIPQYVQMWQRALELALPDRRVEVRHWADITLDAGKVLVVGSQNHKTFNDAFSGLSGEKDFSWYSIDPDELTAHLPSYWHNDIGADYAVVPYGQVKGMEETDEGQAFLHEWLMLNEFAGPPEQNGPQTVFYRTWPMEYETELVFGEVIALRGYDQDMAEVLPGDTVTFRFYWNAVQDPQANYSVFIHLLPTGNDSNLVTQADGPLVSYSRETLTWTDRDETLISQLFTLMIPPDVNPGEYTVWVGVYEPYSGERLLVTQGQKPIGDRVELSHLTINKN